MAYNITPLLGIDFTATFTDLTSAENIGKTPSLGEQATTDDGGEAIFVLAGSAITKSMTCHVTSANSANPLTTALATTAGRIAFAQFSSIASGSYGWLKTRGKVSILLLPSCNASVPLYTSDSAGILDDATATATQYQVNGVIAESSAGASTATTSCFAASYPTILRSLNA